MKKLKELKLNQLNKTELGKDQMLSTKGGYECSCSCESGLQYGMSNVQGYMAHRCDGKECPTCVCDSEDSEWTTVGNHDNVAIL